MRTRSQYRHNSPQQETSPVIVEPLWIEFPFLKEQFEEDPPKDPPKVQMTDNRTMAEMLRAPTERYAEAIIVPPILAEQFELKHSLINTMISEQFFGLEKDNPHDHIRCLRNGISNFEQKFGESFHEAWDRYKDLLRACPHHGFTEIHQLNTFYNALNHTDQDSLNAAAGGNLLERSTQDVLMIIENKSKLTHAVNEQTSAVTTTMTAMLKKFHATQPPAPVKAVKETCVTCRGAHPYYQCLATGGKTFPEFRDNIQEYVSAAAANYNQGSGSLPSNTIANPKGKLKAITTRSGIVIDGPTVPTPPTSINSEVDERVEETFTDPNLAECTIKVPAPRVPKSKPPTQKEFVVHQRDPLHLNIPYPSRMLKQKQQEKDEVQIQNFWQMFKQLHVNITLADALILMPKYQKMLKALMSNKAKLQELANTPLNENCSAVILKKLPEKLGDPGKFLIPYGFSELKCKALADLGASINLIPLFVWKKLGLPELISTHMTLELANRAICTPTEISRDVFVPVGKFTFPADFVIVDYESDPRVPLILGRPFLRTARALIDVNGEELILRDGDKRLTLNMKHDTASYSNHPQRESANLINSFNVSSEHFLKVLVSNQQSGNPALSLYQEFTSPKVTHKIHDSKGCNFLSEILPDIDAFNDIHPNFDDDPLSGSTTYSANSLLQEFTNELALITYPSDYDDNLQFDIESDLKEIEFILYQGKDSSFKDSSIQTDLANHDDYFVDPIPEMFTKEHAPDYSSPLKFDDFSGVDNLPSPDNEDKVFNPGILIHEKSVTTITCRVAQEKKLAISYASLVFKDFKPPFYAPWFFKDVPKSRMLLPFSTKNKEKVFNPGDYPDCEVSQFVIYKSSHPQLHFGNPVSKSYRLTFSFGLPHKWP
nr:reverse transcriptase domain-containing protein [Tanacetum cinerariifolium]